MRSLPHDATTTPTFATLAPLLFVSLLALSLSGCSSDEAALPPPEEAPGVVTDPRDLDATLGPGAHVHDYWGGQASLMVLDEPAAARPTMTNEDDFWYTFLPPDGKVVPQGSAWLEVTLLGADAAGPRLYGHKEIWAQGPSDTESFLVAAAEFGDTVNMTLASEDSDLPHQVLSSWLFRVVFTVDVPVTGSFAGEVGLQVRAIRGLPLEPFPAHPDLWQGRDEIPLFAGEGFPRQYCALACGGTYTPQYAPEDGILVPPDAMRVVVTLHLKAPAGNLVLQYHGADTRDYSAPTPIRESGGVRTYELPVQGAGDGPYGEQSLWRFRLVLQNPGAYAGEFTIEAKAQRR